MLVLLCVVDRQLEAVSIPGFVTFNYVCVLKILVLGGSYPSAASTHRGQVVLFLFFFCFCFFLRGGGGGRGWRA